MNQVLTERERAARREHMRDLHTALHQGITLEEFSAVREKLVGEWAGWFHNEMNKQQAQDPVEVLPQALASLEMRALGEARRVAESVAKEAVKNMLRKVLV
jgi:hypothetical protein